MTLANIERVLLESDGPQLILLRDAVEAAWVGVATDRNADGDAFACVQVSPKRLAALKLGDTDLRALFEAPEVERRATLFVPADWEAGLAVTLQDVVTFQAEWLPAAGFYLSMFGAPVADANRDLIAEAVKRSRPVVHLNLNPPEAAEHALRIDAFTLSEALALFQNAVRRAHSVSIRHLSDAKRKLVSASENYTLQVFGFAPGSFEVHLQAKSLPNLLGETPHVDALKKLDEFASQVENPSAAIEVAKENRGHFVTAVRDLLHFVAESKTPITYSWTEPTNSKVRSATIRPDAAEILYNQLATRQDLSQQDVTLIGVFDKLDVNNGRWRMLTPDGERGGTIATDSGVSLGGLTTTTKYYRLKCKEVLDEHIVSGKQTTRLELLQQPEEVEGLAEPG